jgi:hypothetical protein
VVDNDSGGQRSTLLQQLKEGSEYLENQKEDLLRVWECFKGKIISFYELNKTLSVIGKTLEWPGTGLRLGVPANYRYYTRSSKRISLPDSDLSSCLLLLRRN